MITKNKFKFFEGETSTGTSNVLKNPDSDLLVLTVVATDTFKLNVKGKTDESDTTYKTIAAINNESFNVIKDITASGIYSISISGYVDLVCEIVTNDGTINVTGKVGC